MTHDELLAKINYEIDLELQGMDAESWHAGARALRAVVELHKVLLVKNYENDTDWYSCQACGGTEYPCETIQAIEKELG